MFNVGDLAVYPAHGVGKVEKIESKEISGSTMDFYILRILDSGMKIMIPRSNVEQVGLREVIDQKKVPQIYRILKDREMSVDMQTWNRRYREYMEKIKSGSLFEIAEVLRDLYLLKAGKDLSFGERKMFDTARALLVKEISIAKGQDEGRVEAELEKLLNRTASGARAKKNGKRARVAELAS